MYPTDGFVQERNTASDENLFYQADAYYITYSSWINDGNPGSVFFTVYPGTYQS